MKMRKPKQVAAPQGGTTISNCQFQIHPAVNKDVIEAALSLSEAIKLNAIAVNELAQILSNKNAPPASGIIINQPPKENKDGD